jgi:hypothetical protein
MAFSINFFVSDFGFLAFLTFATDFDLVRLPMVRLFNQVKIFPNATSEGSMRGKFSSRISKCPFRSAHTYGGSDGWLASSEKLLKKIRKKTYLWLLVEQ